MNDTFLVYSTNTNDWVVLYSRVVFRTKLMWPGVDVQIHCSLKKKIASKSSYSWSLATSKVLEFPVYNMFSHNQFVITDEAGQHKSFISVQTFMNIYFQ